MHLGGVSVERPFEEILEANINGIFNVYEAARRHGVKRVVFASSNHVIGFYKQDEHIDAHAPRRPDGYYGLSKSFGEDMAQFYFDRYGIETVSIRIGSSFPEPANRRMMSTWLSYRDLTELIEKSLFTPDVKHTVVYGMSANRDLWWDNGAAAHLGFEPQDSSEVFRAKVEAQPPVAPTDPTPSTRAVPSPPRAPSATEAMQAELILDARSAPVKARCGWRGSRPSTGSTFPRASCTASFLPGAHRWTGDEMLACIAPRAGGRRVDRRHGKRPVRHRAA